METFFICFHTNCDGIVVGGMAMGPGVFPVCQNHIIDPSVMTTTTLVVKKNGREQTFHCDPVFLPLGSQELADALLAYNILES